LAILPLSGGAVEPPEPADAGTSGSTSGSGPVLETIGLLSSRRAEIRRS
jgi:hypothetical protein